MSGIKVKKGECKGKEKTVKRYIKVKLKYG